MPDPREIAERWLHETAEVLLRLETTTGCQCTDSRKCQRCGILDMWCGEFCRAVLAAPRWHDKPTGPGLWLTNAPGHLTVTVEQGDDFDDYPIASYFGPIPPQRKEGSDHA